MSESSWAVTQKDWDSVPGPAHKSYGDKEPVWTRAARRKKLGLPSLSLAVNSTSGYTLHDPQLEKQIFVEGFLSFIDWNFVDSQLITAKTWLKQRDRAIQRWDRRARHELEKFRSKDEQTSTVEKYGPRSLEEIDDIQDLKTNLWTKP